MFGPERIGSWQVSSLRLLVSVTAVVPPAMAVGLSLPMIMAAVRRSTIPAGSRSLRLYSVYTAGGALGLAFVVSIALQRFGARGAMVAMIALNLAAACLCWLRATRAGEAVSEEASPRERSEGCAASAFVPWAMLFTAFFSGAGIIAVEVLSIELVNLTTPLAFYPQAAILFSAVTILAIAAAVSPKMVGAVRSPSLLVPLVLSLAGPLIASIPLLLVHAIASRVPLGYGNSMGAFLVQMLGTGLCVLGLPLLVAGMVFPLLMVMPSAGAPAPLACLLAANGFGGLAGAEIALRLLLPFRGVHVALGLVGCMYAMTAILWVSHGRGDRGWSRLILPLGALTLCVLAVKGPLSGLPVFIDAPAFKVIDVSSSREGSLAVVEREGMGRGMIFDNQYLLGASGGTPEMQRQAHIPLLLHPDPRRIAFLGLGTGITGSGALLHGPVESVTAVEISPMVAEAAEKYFSDLNGDYFHDARVRVLVEDARTFILSATNHFDVIIGDLFTPWRPGESRLCTLEQFQGARRALRPQGVFCQWFPMHQLTRDQFETIAATFQQAFPHTYMFRNHFKKLSVPLALVGFADGDLNWEIVGARAQHELRRDVLRDPLCRHGSGLATLFLGEWAPGNAAAGVNTLENLRIELGAEHNLILKGYDRFLAGESPGWANFVESQVERLVRGAALPASLRPLPAIGLLVGRYDDAVRSGDSAAALLRRSLAQALPEEILSDTRADWSLWPGLAPFTPGAPVRGAN